jgi:Sulfotransferase domain
VSARKDAPSHAHGSNGAGRLPNLLIAGVPKGGTGSLFAYLRQHPDVCASIKETGYFSSASDEGTLGEIAEYRQLFSHCRCEKYVLEATPAYSFCGEPVVRAIKHTLGNVHVIIVLRDPTARLWSAYTFQRSWGRLPGIASFEQYVRECQAQRSSGNNIIPEGAFNGLSIGYYADYLGAWLDAFGADLRIVFFDDLARDPKRVAAELCRWLAIDDTLTTPFDFRPHNRTLHPRSLTLTTTMSAVKQRAGRLLDATPALRRAIRHVYFKLNSGQLHEQLHPETRRFVEALYHESMAATARLLRSHGYSQLPDWLSSK